MVKIFGKRGQAALEFLTTYGWAFMVILVMIGALAYFGVLNPQNIIPDQCAITGGYTCADFQLQTTQLQINVINNMGETMTLTAGNVSKNAKSITTGACSFTPSATVEDGGAVIINCPLRAITVAPDEGLDKTAGQKAKLGFAFVYTKSGSTLTHQVTGTITATVQ